MVLERWHLQMVPSPAGGVTGGGLGSAAGPDLPSVYKHAILFFRTLFALSRALPAYGLSKRLARRAVGGGSGQLRIGVRMRMGEGAGVAEGAGGGGGRPEIEVEERVGDGTNAVAETVTFPEVVTPVGYASHGAWSFGTV